MGKYSHQFKPYRHYYNIKRVVMFKDGNFEVQVNTKPYFYHLRRRDRNIVGIYRASHFAKISGIDMSE